MRSYPPLPITSNDLNKAVLDDFINGKSYSVMLCVNEIESTDDNISGLTEIPAGNGYPAGGPSVTVTCVQSGSKAYLVATQPTIAASGGDIGPYKGIAIYETASGRIVGPYNEVRPDDMAEEDWDGVTIANGTSKVIQFNQVNGFLSYGPVTPYSPTGIRR